MDGNEYDEFTAKVRVPKGARLARSRKTEGAYRGITDPGTDQMGQAEIFLMEKNEPDPVATYPRGWPESDLYESEARAQERRENAEFFADVLVQVGLKLVEKAAPHVRKWWFEQALPAVKSKWKDQKILTVQATWSSVIRHRPSDCRSGAEGDLQEAVILPGNQGTTMSSAEARKRIEAAVVARLYSDGQLRLVRDARVVEEGEHGLVDLGATSDLTLQCIGEQTALMLEAYHSLLGRDALAELGKLIAGIRANGDAVALPRAEGAMSHDYGND